MKNFTTLAKHTIIYTTLAVNCFAEWSGESTAPSTTRDIDGKKFYVITSPEELAWIYVTVKSGDSTFNAILDKDIVMGVDESTASTKIAPYQAPLTLSTFNL